MPSRYSVRITDFASANLESIFGYISQQSPQNAATVIRRLLDAIDDLETMPGRFRIAGRSLKRGTTVHACTVRPFIIYFRIDEAESMATVLEVRHRHASNLAILNEANLLWI